VFVAAVDLQAMLDRPTIDRAFFREAEDGTTVFFPWGFTHRGYRLTGAGERKKASRAASILISSTIAIGTWTAYALQPLLESETNDPPQILRALVAPGVVLVLAVFGYWLWASRFVERFPESDLKVSREERLREAAELASPRKVALIGVIICGLSALLIWLQPHAWWLGLLGIALGVGTLFWSSLLKRAAEGPD
jgi:MFS family permease